MHEKMLKAINLYWFHNDASERKNSLNGYSNEPQINGGSLYLLPTKILDQTSSVKEVVVGILVDKSLLCHILKNVGQIFGRVALYVWGFY